MRKFLCICLAITLCLCLSACKSTDYKQAMEFFNAGAYQQAKDLFVALGDYKDSARKIADCDLGIRYNEAMALMKNGIYQKAIAAFEALDGYRDSAQQIQLCKEAAYAEAAALMADGKYQEAYNIFGALDGYADSAEKQEACQKVYVRLSEFADSYEITYAYDHGRLAKETAVNRNSKYGTVMFDHWYVDSGAKVTQEYHYDTRGNMIKRVGYVHGKKATTWTYEYDSKDHVIKETEDNVFGSTYTYEYDDRGNKTVESYYSYGVEKVVGNTTYLGEELECSYKYDYAYDEHNQLIRKTTWSKQNGETSITYTNVYDSSDRLIKQSSLSSSGEETVWEYVYDDSGNLTEERGTDASGSYEYHYEYDDAGNRIAERGTKPSGSFEYRYEYDEFGNMTLFENVDNGFVRRYTYGYVNRFA